MTTQATSGSNRLLRNGFRLTDEQQEILDQADRFARAELAPLQQRMDDEEWWPPQVMPALARMGFLGVTAPTRTRRRGERLLHLGPDYTGSVRGGIRPWR